jgi:Flp pilus assembly protein CpaB
MNKLKIFAIMGLAAAVIGTAGLVAAPSASARPARHDARAVKAAVYRDSATTLTWMYAPALPK